MLEISEKLRLKDTPLSSYVTDVAIPTLALVRVEKDFSDPREDVEVPDCPPQWFDLEVFLSAEYGANNVCERRIPCRHGDCTALVYVRSIDDFYRHYQPRTINPCYEDRPLQDLLSDQAIFAEKLIARHEHLFCGDDHGFHNRRIELILDHNVLKSYDVHNLRIDTCCSRGKRYVFDYYSGPLESFMQEKQPTVSMPVLPGLEKASQVIEEFTKIAAGRKLSEEQLTQLRKGREKYIESIKWPLE